MGESFEFGSRKKLTRIREDLSKRELDVRNFLADIEKIKVEALKKTEEMKYSAQHDVEKVVQDMIKEKNLDQNVKARLDAEIDAVKAHVEKKYSELTTLVLEKTASSH